MSAPILERLAPQFEQLAQLSSAETGRPPAQPGVVCIPYETATGTHPQGLLNTKRITEALTAGEEVELSHFQKLIALKAKLEEQGVYCSLSFHRTESTFDFIADDSPDGHHYEQTKDGERFALFTLEGVGEPTQEALQGLSAPGSLYAGQNVTFGGETYHSRYFTNNPGTGPSEEAMALAPDVTELRNLLTGFQAGLTPDQHSRWTRLQAEAANLDDVVRYMQSPADRDSKLEHIQKTRAELRDKQEEIRDLLACAVPASENDLVERRRQAQGILGSATEDVDVDTRDSWVRLRDTYGDVVPVGTLRVVHGLQQDVKSLEGLMHSQVARNAQLYPDGWPADAFTVQQKRMLRLKTLNDRIRAILHPEPAAAPAAQPQTEQLLVQPSIEARPKSRISRILGLLSLRRSQNNPA